MKLDAALAELEGIKIEEAAQDLLRRKPNRLQQRRDRHLSAPVDPEEQDIFRIEFKIKPRSTIGNHASREQQLARTVRLAAIMLEEHARRAVQLGNDYALGPVDDERSGGRHERNFAHVNFLLLNFLDRIGNLAVENDQSDF